MPLFHRRCETKGLPSLTLSRVQDQPNPTPDLVGDFKLTSVLGSNFAPKVCEAPI